MNWVKVSFLTDRLTSNMIEVSWTINDLVHLRECRKIKFLYSAPQKLKHKSVLDK